MHICIYIYNYANLCAYLHVYTCKCICTHIRIYIYTYTKVYTIHIKLYKHLCNVWLFIIHIQAYICMHTKISVYVNINMYATADKITDKMMVYYTHTSLYIHICVYIHIQAYTCTYAYIYTYKRIHTRIYECIGICKYQDVSMLLRTNKRTEWNTHVCYQERANGRIETLFACPGEYVCVCVCVYEYKYIRVFMYIIQCICV